MYLYASKKININDNFYSLKKRKSFNEFYSACKKERFILSFSHNFTTLLLHNFTSKECRNFSFPSLPSTPLRMTKVEKFLSKKWNRLPLGFGETYFILTTPIAISQLASTTLQIKMPKFFFPLASFDSAQDDRVEKFLNKK